MGNRLLSLAAVGDCGGAPERGTPLFLEVVTGLRGIEVATSVSKATTIIPAPMITNRFCRNFCLARNFARVTGSGCRIAAGCSAVAWAGWLVGGVWTPTPELSCPLG